MNMMNTVKKWKNQCKSAMIRFGTVMESKKGEGYVDSGIKILIAVVIGSLLLSSLYGIMNTDIIPVVKDKIADLFAYHA